MKENPYLENMVKTASPAKIVQMLYEKAIEHLNESEKLLEEGNYIQFSERVGKAQDIITELNLSLDMERGGEIAKNLRALYTYMYRELVEAVLRKDKTKVSEVRGMLSELLETWKEAMRRATTSKPEERQTEEQRGGLNLLG